LAPFLAGVIILTLIMGSQSANAAKMLAASGGDISIDYAAAAPFTYDHTTGAGGQYNQGGANDIVESLEGGDFNCGDIVVFFDAITVSGSASAGASTIQVVNSYNRFTTSGGNVGFWSVYTVFL
jgi:hypothetical protein